MTHRTAASASGGSVTDSSVGSSVNRTRQMPTTPIATPATVVATPATAATAATTRTTATTATATTPGNTKTPGTAGAAGSRNTAVQQAQEQVRREMQARIDARWGSK